jgi:hypothetical protein
LAGVALAASSTVWAQTAVNLSARECGVFDAQGDFSLTTPPGSLVGRHIVVAVASSDPQISDLVIDDGAGTVYRPLGGRKAREEPNSLVLLQGKPTSIFAGAITFRARARAVNAGAKVCLSLQAFDGLTEPFAGPRSGDANAAVSDSPGSTHGLAADGTSLLMYAAFSFASDPGTLSPFAGATVQQPVCASGGGVCLASAYTISAAAGVPNVTVSAGAAVAWRAVSAAVPSEAVFRDGFE